MAHKIAVACQKGGIGKTTTSVILSKLLAESGYSVLVLDLDSQGNATTMITGENIYSYSGKTILEAMKEKDATKYLIHHGNIDLIPAEDMLITFSRYIYSKKVPSPMRVLKETIEEIESNYDFIIMDCPPNLGDIVLNAIVYADYAMIPTTLDGFGINALDKFIDFLVEAKEEGHTNIKILGIVMTLKDNRSSLEREVAETIREKYEEFVFESEIRRRAVVKEFTVSGVNMTKKREMDGLEDYLNLTMEVVYRVKRMEGIDDVK